MSSATPRADGRGGSRRERAASGRGARGALGLLLAAVVGVGCAHAAVAEPPVAAGRSARLYVYPAQGQSRLQQDRDRYECYRWAKRGTGYDPSLDGGAPRERVRVVSTRPPGADTLAAAATGALIGAASTHHHGEGAAIGAAIGAVVGAASDVYREHTRRTLEAELSRPSAPRPGAESYQRAFAACLEGRGYSVE